MKVFLKENRESLIFLSLILVCVAIYGQTVNFDFINTDDIYYVYENTMVLSGLNWNSVYWAFTAFHSANWHPLTWISHQIDVSLFGLNPGAHHATNVVFHILNSLLAFAVFKRLTNDFWKSAFVAVFFAVHPTHVESVAWVSERKDVLSTMFWLLTMLAYASYCESRQNSARFDKVVTLKYLAVIFLFALGLMSKPMLVTLPFVLLLCDYWPLERLKKLGDLQVLILEKLPMFILTAVSSYITFIAQRAGGAVEGLESLPLDVRLINAVISYTTYVVMMFYPVNLGLQYPYRRVLNVEIFIASLIFLIIISAFCLWQWRKRKYLIVGWLWFLGTLVPVIGIVQVGAQAMADRYTYIPYFGLFIALVWGVGELAERLNLQRIAVIVGFLATIALSILAYKQTSYWRNSETLYRYSLSVVGESFLIAYNFCLVLMRQDRLEEAEEFCQKAAIWNREYPSAYNALGIIKMIKQDYEAAVNYFSMALSLLLLLLFLSLIIKSCQGNLLMKKFGRLLTPLGRQQEEQK
ncbi:MAG: tetratricopeptide repeat protein, partial [Pyrinomonadaceae bacterium]